MNQINLYELNRATNNELIACSAPAEQRNPVFQTRLVRNIFSFLVSEPRSQLFKINIIKSRIPKTLR